MSEWKEWDYTLIACNKCGKLGPQANDEVTGRACTYCGENMDFYLVTFVAEVLSVWDEKLEPVCRICGGKHLGLGLCRECCVFLNEAPNDGTLIVMEEARL